MLQVSDLHTFYGTSQALFGLSMEVGTGEVVTLLGRNGMGKTTTVRSIMGLTPPRSGTVMFDGAVITGLPSFKVAQAGLGLVPEGRQIFANLTVRENLIATARPGPWDLAAVHAMFPRLRERGGNMGNQLSGGEQQMLAIGRALMTNPRLIILDEATEGLAPLVRQEIWHCLASLKDAGQSILLIDKNIEPMLRLADRHYMIEKGRVVWSGTSPELEALPELRQRYLGV